MRKRKNRDTIHYNGESVIVELLLSDYALSESALCLRSSHKLVWHAGKNPIRESVEKSEHEHWGDQHPGEDTTSTTSFQEPNASETSKFRVSSSEKSTQTSLWKSNISSSSGEDLVLSDYTNVQRTHSSSWTSWIQVFRNDQCECQNWTSLECTKIKTLWYSCYRGTVPITESTRLFFMDFDMQRTWEICGGVTLLR